MKILFLTAVGLLLLLAKTSLAKLCACATRETRLYKDPGTRQVDSGSRQVEVIAHVDAGVCLQLKNRDLSTDFRDKYWKLMFEVQYKNESAWIGGLDINITTCPQKTLQLPGCPPIVSREEWGARAPSHPLTNLTETPHYAFIHHGDSAPCFTKAECIKKVRAYQNFHMDIRGWWDIGYSFVVGEDGHVYEGRGWDKVGAHTKGYNSVGLGFCTIGNFTDHVPNKVALTVLTKLIQCGKDNGLLTSEYTLRGHRDMCPTTCPGQAYYDLIRTWPHYWK